MTTTPPPAKLPAHITLSLQNVRDFIRAKGQGVPINIPASSLRAFIEDVAQEWTINLTSFPRNLVGNCARAGAVKAEEAIRLLIPADLNPDLNLPKYLAENCARTAAEAAEGAIRPWVLSCASHTSPTRQKAGKAAIRVKQALEDWRQTAGVKILTGIHDIPYLCCANEVIEDRLTEPTYLTACEKQKLVVDGENELDACRNYATANDIGFPSVLSEALAKKVEREGEE